MAKKNYTVQSGLTLTELLLTMAISTIVIIGIGVLIVDTQRGWNVMYSRIYADVVTDSYVARRTFDSIVRKASSKHFLVDGDGNWIEVYYYADSNSAVTDRYARFYYDDGSNTLNIEYGKLDPRETLTNQTVCENVSDCVFKGIGRSAQMILALDNDSRTVTTVSSAVMHNQ